MKIILVIDPAAARVVDAVLFEDAAVVVSAGGEVALPGGGSVAAAEGRLFFEGPGAIGWSWDGAAAVAPPPTAVDLGALKASLKAAIDAEAERQRLRYVTGGSGQAMEYQQAAAEAASYLAAPQPDAPAGTYPMLEAGLGIDGDTLAEVAAVVAGMHAAWQDVGSAIRAARLAGKRAVDLAPDAAAARAVTVNWPNA